MTITADITRMPGLAGWPKGVRVIVRKERPHPGAQLRFTDIDGRSFTCFANDARRGQQLASLGIWWPPAWKSPGRPTGFPNGR